MKKDFKTIHFGEHLTLDGYGGDLKLLDNEKLVFSVLVDLPKMLKMKTLTKPFVVAAPDNGIKDPGGWSGFVVIAESHVSLHTFPKRRFISADVYSCRNGLPVKKIKEYFKKTFKLADLEVNFIKRGTRYPAENLV